MLESLDVVAAVQQALEGFNWGAVALADVNVVPMAGGESALAQDAYALVAAAALCQAVRWRARQRRWLGTVAVLGSVTPRPRPLDVHGDT